MERYPSFLDFTEGFQVENPQAILKWSYTFEELRELFPLYNLERAHIFPDFGQRVIFDDIAVPIRGTIQKAGEIFKVTCFYSELGDGNNMDDTFTYPQTFKDIEQRLKNILPSQQIKESKDQQGSNSIEFECKGAKIILLAQDNGHAYLYKLLIYPKK